MYYVIIVVPLNMVCAALIAACPVHSGRLQWNSWGLFHQHRALLQLSMLLIVMFTLVPRMWSGCGLGRREMLSAKRESGPFTCSSPADLDTQNYDKKPEDMGRS